MFVEVSVFCSEVVLSIPKVMLIKVTSSFSTPTEQKEIEFVLYSLKQNTSQYLQIEFVILTNTYK